MTVIERYKLDEFAIIMALLILVIIIFLIIVAVYFYDFMKSPPSPPTKDEATGLFWVSIVLMFILLCFFIYAIYRVFTYKVPYYVNDDSRMITIDPVTIQSPGQGVLTLVN